MNYFQNRIFAFDSAPCNTDLANEVLTAFFFVGVLDYLLALECLPDSCDSTSECLLLP